MEELRIREISRHTADSAFARWFKAVGNHTHWLAGYLDSILSKPSWLSPSLQGVISTQKLRMWEWRRPVLTAISGVERKYISVLFPSSDSCLTAGMPSGCWTMIMRLCHRRSLKKMPLSGWRVRYHWRKQLRQEREGEGVVPADSLLRSLFWHPLKQWRLQYSSRKPANQPVTGEQQLQRNREAEL